jgi:O-antigen/teichoic acid export membrane protein
MSRYESWSRGLRRPTTAAAGGAILASRFVVTALLNYGLGVVLAWLLTADQFGRVGVVQNIFVLSSFVLSAALPATLAREMARAEDRQVGDAVFRSALLGNCGMGVVLAIGLVVVQQTAAAPLPTSSWLLTVLIACALPLIALNSLFIGALQGTRRFGGMAVVQTADTAVKFIVGVVLGGLLGWGATGVALAFLLASTSAALWGFAALSDRSPGRGPLAASRTFRPAAPIGVATVALGLMTTLDVLVLAAIGRDGDAGVAAYLVAGMLARAVFFIGTALSRAVFPYLARHGPGAESHAWFLAALRWVPIALVPVQLALVVNPEPLLALFFPQQYAGAAFLIRLLALGAVGMLLAELLLDALIALGPVRHVALRATLAAGVQLAALAVLVPRLGTIGAAVSFGIGAWTAVALFSVPYLRMQPRRGVAPSGVLRHVAALGAMVPALVLTLFLPPLAGAIGLGFALVLHLGVARLLGLITQRDVERASRAFTVLFPGRGSGREAADHAHPASRDL